MNGKLQGAEELSHFSAYSSREPPVPPGRLALWASALGGSHAVARQVQVGGRRDETAQA
jgi:hypothetical protein